MLCTLLSTNWTNKVQHVKENVRDCFEGAPYDSTSQNGRSLAARPGYTRRRRKKTMYFFISFGAVGSVVSLARDGADAFYEWNER